MGPTGQVRTGGAASVLEYAKRLQQRGHSVCLCTWPKFLWPEKDPFPGIDFEVDIYFDGAPTTGSLPYHLVNRTPRDYVGELQFFVTYMSLLTPAIPKCDLIISSNWDTILPAWQSRQGKPVHFPQHYDEVFFTLDGATSSSLQGNPLIKLLCRNSFQLPVYRIANSSWLAGELQERFGETVPYVNHGIDCALFQLRPKKSEIDGILRVVTYSRPDKWKGFPDAVAAMQQVLKHHAGLVEWHVYGFQNPAFPPDNALAPYTYHGTLAHEELSVLYAESDIVLCPSWYESFPLPPIEAMACGTAVVTTSYGTEDFAIHEETALVVQPRIVTDMVEAVERLVKDGALRRKLAASGRAMAESLTWDRAVTAREKILYQIHQNALHNDLLGGFDTAIPDGNNISFERIPTELQAPEGELLRDEAGAYYIVESRRLRPLSHPGVLGLNAETARPLDSLILARTDLGPTIHTLEEWYGERR